MSCYFYMIGTLPIASLFPYTTLFRSPSHARLEGVRSVSCTRSEQGILMPFPSRHKVLTGAFAAALTATLALTSPATDRKSTRLNSSHVATSYADFCLKMKQAVHRLHV